MDPQIELLLTPISDAEPCGENLEDSQLLASFDAYHVFGQMAPPAEEIDWRELRDKSLEALATSKDLRLLAHLGAAVLRTSGLGAFCDVLVTAGHWFQMFPEAVYPRVDEDAILRRNALNNFVDRVGVLDSLRRQPLVSNPQLGSFSLRDVLVVGGKLTVAEGSEATATDAQIKAMLTAAAQEYLEALTANLGGAVAALGAIEALMRDANGIEAAPDFGPLREMLDQMRAVIDEELASRAGATGGDEAIAGDESPPGTIVTGVGSIKSRQDAIHALDAVAEFFRRNEPSSPVPLLVERAKRLVAKDFLEVLADLAPGALDQARQSAGVRTEHQE